MLIWGSMAQEMTTSIDPVAWLVNYGVAGVVIALLVVGRLRTKSEVDGLQKLADERLKQLREHQLAVQAMVQQITQHTVPQLTEATKVIQDVPVPRNTEMEMLRRLEALTTALDTIQRNIEANSRRLDRIERGE